jgi:tripeptide aminopeptidase
MQGDVEKATLYYIIRDHDFEKFEEKKELLIKIGEKLNEKYGNGSVCVSVKDSYFNMKQMIEPCMFIVERAKKAMEALGITPITVPIRGGTDGARLSYMGLPCPNLCTGGANFHSRFEYIPVEDMQRITKMLVQLLTHIEG